MDLQQLPVLHEPHDALRNGLPAAVPSLVAPAPPVAAVAPRLSMRQVFGIGAAMRAEQDAKLMENFHRFPGLASSFVGLQTVNGRLNDLELDDWLGEPLERKNLACEFHVTMERALKM